MNLSITPFPDESTQPGILREGKTVKWYISLRIYRICWKLLASVLKWTACSQSPSTGQKTCDTRTMALCSTQGIKTNYFYTQVLVRHSNGPFPKFSIKSISFALWAMVNFWLTYSWFDIDIWHSILTRSVEKHALDQDCLLLFCFLASYVTLPFAKILQAD